MRSAGSRRVYLPLLLSALLLLSGAENPGADETLAGSPATAASLSPADYSPTGPVDASAEPDTDGDGIPDGVELATGTDPNDPDTDGDGLSDGAERSRVRTHGFSPARIVGHSSSVGAVAVGDLDGDGDVDVVADSSTDVGDYLSWFENRGGLLTYAGHLVGSLPYGIHKVFAADLDGDDDLDLLAASPTRLVWFENTDGLGHFGPERLVGTDVLDPTSLTAADLDGDGDLDVLVTSQGDATVGWWENEDGAGTFGARRVIDAAAVGAASAQAIDVDGFLDVVASSVYDDAIRWYRNEDGVGSFALAHEEVGAIDSPSSLQVADVDGDGDLDWVASSTYVGTIDFLPGDPDPTVFGSPELVSDAGSSIDFVVAADLDFDGDLDLASADWLGGKLRWSENQHSAPVFAPAQEVDGAASGVEQVRVADMDGDGDLDLVAAVRGTSQVTWYENTGSDPLNPDSDGDGLLDGQEEALGTDPVAADSDGDGLLDADELARGTDPLLADSDADGLGDGAEIALGSDPLDPDSNHDGVLDGDEDPDQDGLGNAAEEAAGTDPAVADTDRDGASDGDEVGVHGTDPLSPDTDGDGMLDGFEITYGLDPFTPDQQGDPDGDGLTNLGEQSGGTNPLDPDSDGDGLSDGEERRVISQRGFGAPRVIDLPDVSANFRGVVAADWDGDGDRDLVAYEPAVGLYAYENLGGGVFAPRQALASIPDVRTMSTPDLDGDGDPDLLVISNSLGVVWFPNEGGTFGPVQTIDPPDLALLWFHVDAVAADLDGDGDQDVVWVSLGDPSFGRIVGVGWNENLGGSLGFAPAREISSIQYGAEHIWAADLDGDGDVDLTVQGYSEPSSLYENLGGGVFVPRPLDPSTPSDQVSGPLVPVDIDGDLDLDLVTAGSIRLNDGFGSFTSQLAIPAVSDLQAIDVDSDGDPDLVSHTLWLENLGNGQLATRDGIGAPTSATGLAVPFAFADVDGDGDPDLVAGEESLLWYPNPGSNALVTDSDGDGLSDAAELAQGTDASAPDTDGDGLDDGSELAQGTDPTRFDSDGDGLGDGEELQVYASNPLLADSDGDGLSDGVEVRRTGTDPGTSDSGGMGVPDADRDADGDGLSNGEEIEVWHSDPARSDTDGDGLPDGVEVAMGTSPVLVDSDGDRLRDSFELDHGLDPTTPGDGRLDPDGDGLVHVAEQSGGTDPLDPDSDGDGLPDGVERVRTPGVPFPSKASSIGSLYYWNDGGPISTLAVDLDGDSALEVVIDSRPDVIVFAKPGPGAAFQGRDLFPVCPGWTNVVAGDFDGDGDADLAFGCSGGARVYWNDGAGAFPGAPTLLLRWPTGGSVRVRAADVNGDGLPDLVGWGGGVVAWLDDRDGFASQPAWQPIATGAAADLVLSDLDRDGDLDLVVADADPGSVAWYENRDGRGGFGAPREIGTLPSTSALQVADLDGDGDDDVLAGSAAGGIRWWPNEGGGAGFGAPRTVDAGPCTGCVLTSGDLDGDGDVDVVSVESWGVVWFENLDQESGDGSSGWPQWPVVEQSLIQALSLADLDGDGDLDVLLDRQTGVGWVENPGTDPHAADSDGDGLQDGDEDSDGDGWRDRDEVVSLGTDPNAPDTDGDGLDDQDEIVRTQTDPTLADSDGDGWLDGEELGFGTDPNDGTVPSGRPRLPVLWERDFGRVLYGLGPDDAPVQVPLGFSFPFGARTYSAFWVDDDGTICSFYCSILHYASDRSDPVAAFRSYSGPLLAPLWIDLDPAAGGQVWLHDFGDRAVVTWDHMRPAGVPDASVTVQLQLWADGRFAFSYAGLFLPSSTGAVAGVLRSGERGSTATPADYTGDSPLQDVPGTYEAFCEGGCTAVPAGTSPIDLDRGTLLFTPTPAGFDVRFIPEPGAGTLGGVALLVLYGLRRWARSGPGTRRQQLAVPDLRHQARRVEVDPLVYDAVSFE